MIAVTPGPSVLLVSAQSMKAGRKAGFFGALGIQLANGCFFLLSALGLSQFVRSAEMLSEALKVAGAIYLSFISIKLWRASGRPKRPLDVPQERTQKEDGTYFLQGLMTGLSNPKAILFFVAVLPPLMDPAKEMKAQFVVAGLTVIGVEWLVLLTYSFLATAGLKKVQSRKGSDKWRDRVVALILLAVAVKILLMR